MRKVEINFDMVPTQYPLRPSDDLPVFDTVHNAVTFASQVANHRNHTVSIEFGGKIISVEPRSDINAIVHRYWAASIPSPR